jgi:molecular chaperone GrpE
VLNDEEHIEASFVDLFSKNQVDDDLELSKEQEQDNHAPEQPTISPEQALLLQDFSAFLLDEQEPSTSADSSVDLFSLLREMAELKNEVKLESRQIKKTLDDFKELIGLLKSNNELLSQELTQQHDFQKRAKEQQRKEYALELIGFCDYLMFSLENMRQSRKTDWFSRRFGSEKFINKVIEGQNLLLLRFSAILKGLGVTPMSVVDHPFDPAIMCASETCCQPEHPNGIVISEIQMGYFIDKSVLRLAGVIVNKLTKDE